MDLIDPACLDLQAAFDFAILIEEDAQDRYARFATQLGDDPGGAGAVFRELVVTEARHRDDLVARRAELFPDAPRLELALPGETPEGPAADDDLPRSAREALETALAAERRAHAYYLRLLPHVRDAAVRAFFERMVGEEADHAAALAAAIAARGEEDAPALSAPPRAAPGPVAAPPDVAALRDALPGFDAATRAIAARVVVEGQPEAQVAAALGISRRTVARRLARFLELARRPAAIGLAAATLSGCTVAASRAEGHGRLAPELRRAAAPPVSLIDPGVPYAEGPGADGAGRAAAVPLQAIAAHLAARMARHDAAERARLARTLADEAARARLDPALVLALIHVESSFRPDVVSSARAVGLMQLREPTFHRERARSGLPDADPLDPVANVQAGVRYLRRLIDAFQGDLRLALMAYNAGPNRIRGHLRGGGVPERFHEYPRKVLDEVRRVRQAASAAPLWATSGAPSRFGG